MKSALASVILGLLVLQAWTAPFDQALFDKHSRTYEPGEALKHIQVPEGYRLELVAAEPMVNEPAVIAWDGNGVMYVAEFLTYMQDIDGSGAHNPVSRILRLEDTDDDGRMDKRTVFIDKLVLPRMIQCIDHRVIIRETNTFDLNMYEDSDGDGVADKKTSVYTGGKRGGNLEHQPSGLIWNIDNWMYVTYTRKRYRWNGDHIISEDTPHGSGQWGLTHDDIGRCYYSTGGGERPAMDFQQPIIYGKIQAPGEEAPGFREVFPIVHIPDVQGGHRRYRKEENTLNNFTGCAGQHIYRGDRLPAELYGQLFIPEPVGRLIRLAKVSYENGKVVLSNATPGTEFIRSDDANFRPLNMATGPDGCLYIVDMYRGIIQEGNWVRRGSYLRGVVENYGLDKNVQRGRIYRLMHETTKRGPKPKLLDASGAELVQALEHPNGWWRDTAQKLLVVRGDASVVPALKSLVRSGKSPLARLHALWSLEGLGTFDTDLLKAAMKDPDPRVRGGAIRVSEEATLKGETGLAADMLKGIEDPDPQVVIQSTLSLLRAQPDASLKVMEAVLARHPDNVILQQLGRSYQGRIAQAKRTMQQSALMGKGKANYETLCVACHAANGLGTPMEGQKGQTLGPTLKNSPRLLSKNKSIPIKIVLKGMTGELDGKTYPGPMLPLESFDDEFLASVLTYARGSFGNKGDAVSAGDIAMVRKSIADRKLMWQSDEILAEMPVPRQAMQSWIFTSSHNGNGAKAAVDADISSRWDTAMTQRPGMWFSFDMKKPLKLDTVILDSSKSPLDYPRDWTLHVSDDGKKWSEPVASGKGRSAVTEILLPGITTRYVRINQHGKSNGKYWSIHNLEVYGKPIAQ
ncbi:MAG: discoidin domain-containing protein [Verrucomicrobiota bacterium]